MLRKLLGCFVVLALAGLSGCIDSSTVVTVDKTGAGTLVETTYMSKAMQDMMAQMAGAMGGAQTNGTAAKKNLVLQDEAKYKAKAGAMGAFEWVFVGPQATLNGRGGQALGSYFGPPATWAANDGSKVTATQVAVAPAGTGNIPMQLVKANPAVGMGAMTGVAYIQRVATQGGVAPATECAAASLGRKEVVKYQADYIFWKPV